MSPYAYPFLPACLAVYVPAVLVHAICVGQGARVWSQSAAETGITTHLLQLGRKPRTVCDYLPVPCLAFFPSPPFLPALLRLVVGLLSLPVWGRQVHAAHLLQRASCCETERLVGLVTWEGMEDWGGGGQRGERMGCDSCPTDPSSLPSRLILVFRLRPSVESAA